MSAPATTSSGARSPPMASTAIRIKALRSGRAERLDLAALVRAAGRADGVRALRLVTRRARLHAHRGELEVRAPLVAPRLGCLALRDCHDRPRSIAAATRARARAATPPRA